MCGGVLSFDFWFCLVYGFLGLGFGFGFSFSFECFGVDGVGRWVWVVLSFVWVMVLVCGVLGLGGVLGS